jgi:hypothetical protein
MASIQGGVLIGWMERDQAVSFLRNDCDFGVQLTEAQAEDRWRPYRERVEALGPRLATAPIELPLNPTETRAAQRFTLHFKLAPNILRVVKVDPMQLVVHQLVVVTERSEQEYVNHVRTDAGWLAKALNTTASNHQLPMRHGPNAMEFDVPHMEFMMNFVPGQWGVQELARYVGVTAYEGRMMLWAGYHRSYARVSSMAPDAIDRSLVVVLTTDGDFVVAPASPNQGLRAMLCGLRAPLFADFFDDRFFMSVPLRRRRFVLQVRAQVVPLDA